MPPINLGQEPKTLSLYDVVGQRQAPDNFIKHVAFHDADDQPVEMDGDVIVVHMSPPLERGKTIKAHAAGHVPFTNDEIKEISAWIEEIKDEYRQESVSSRNQYIIHPPWKDKCDRHTNVRRYRRYSCVGFVLDGHREVDIELLPIDEDSQEIDKESLPDTSPHTIESIYAQNPRGGRLSAWGIEGEGPWKIVLPGYVLHALDRPTEQIHQGPYHAQEGDEQF